MNLEKYKHISFDLDGTLVHTASEYRYRIVPVAVIKLGGQIKEKHHIDKFWFGSDRDTMIKKDFEVEPASFWSTFKELDTVAERSLHTRAYDDAESSLRKLNEAGKLISIITGAPHWIAEMEIAKLNGAPHDFYFSISEDALIKPNPESLYFVMSKLLVKPSETLYIGNSNEDAYFARNAGVDFMHLDRKEYQFNLARHSIAIINSLDELFI